jgi:hypothetical protein
VIKRDNVDQYKYLNIMCSQQQDRPSFQITFICTNKTKKIYGIQIYIQLCTLLTNIRFIFISSKKRWNREPLESFSGLFSSKCKYILCMYVFYFTKNVCVLCLCCNLKSPKQLRRNKHRSDRFQYCSLWHIHPILLQCTYSTWIR